MAGDATLKISEHYSELNRAFQQNSIRYQNGKTESINTLGNQIFKAIPDTQQVHISTIFRDVIALKLPQQFVYDLRKSDLAYYYKQCLDGIEEVQSRARDIFTDYSGNLKDKLLALKLYHQYLEWQSLESERPGYNRNTICLGQNIFRVYRFCKQI